MRIFAKKYDNNFLPYLFLKREGYKSYSQNQSEEYYSRFIPTLLGSHLYAMTVKNFQRWHHNHKILKENNLIEKSNQAAIFYRLFPSCVKNYFYKKPSKPFFPNIIRVTVVACISLALHRHIFNSLFSNVLSKYSMFQGFSLNAKFTSSWSLSTKITFIQQSVLIAPAFEEVLCRGYMHKYLIEIMPEPKSYISTCIRILLNGILFGLMHLWNIPIAIYLGLSIRTIYLQSINATILGIIFSAIREKDNHIITTTTAHFINNAYACFSMFKS